MFYPGERETSPYVIDYEKWVKRGKKGIIYDIDNTLVPHGAPADEHAAELFAHLKHIGMKTCLLSNNREPRVKPFADKVGSFFICGAGKPKKAGYLEACRLMEITPGEALFIGDQIFTDVWGANRTGIYSILVRPLDPKEEIQIVLKRIPEKIILFFYWFRERRRQKTS